MPTQIIDKPRRLRYVHQVRANGGKTYYYFRKPGNEKVALPSNPNSPQFIKAYESLLKRVPLLNQAYARLNRIDIAQYDRPPPNVGVYLLFHNDEITYVGSSVNMPKRVESHRTNGRPFDRAYFIATKVSERGQVERSLIRALRPSQNRIGKTSG